MSDFVKELEDLINRNSIENGSNTPDFILAEYLRACLIAFETASNNREKWYGVTHITERSVWDGNASTA